MSPQDDDLHDARISALYRQLDDVEPSAGTDAQVLAAARRAVQAGPRPSRLTFASKRLLAAAAMLLLGVGLVLQLQLREPQEFADALVVRQAPAVAAAQEDSTREVQSDFSAPQTQAENATSSAPTASDTTARRRARQAAPAEFESGVDAAAAPEADHLIAGEPRAEAPASGAGSAATSPSIASTMESSRNTGAANASQKIAEPEVAVAAPGQATPAAPAAAVAERELALRSEAAARSARSYAPAREKKAEAVGQATNSAPDYRQLMGSARYAEALEHLPGTGPASSTIDRDLLELLLGQRAAPTCSHLPAPELGREKLLCDFLQAHARREPLPADWLLQLDQQGLTSGASLYRRRAAENLLRR